MAKRDYGTGGIEDRGDGRWQIRWYDPPDPLTGKRRRRAETITGTKKQAMQVLSQRTAVATVDPASITLATTIAAGVRSWLHHR